MNRSASRWRVVVVTAALCGLLATSCEGDDDADEGAPSSSPGPSESSATQASDGDPCGESVPRLSLPPGLEAAECRWTTQAEDIVGLGDTMIATEEVTAGFRYGEFIVKAVDAATGDVLWTTPRITVVYDDPHTDELADARRSLDIVHWGSEPYAAFTYLTSAEGQGRRDAVVAAATFVPLTESGSSPDPVTWTAPATPDPFAATRQQYVWHDVVGAFVQATTLAIDPTVGDTRSIQTSWQGAQPTIGDGWFAETAYGKPGFTVKDYDGRVLWDSADHVPGFADNPEVYRYPIAAFGDKLLALWAACSRCDAPLVLVLHDEDGRVIDSGTVGSGLGDRVTSLLPSPSERCSSSPTAASRGPSSTLPVGR
jgi:hypothetical protein